MPPRSPLDWEAPIVPPGTMPASRPAPQTGFMENASAGAEEMAIAGNIGSQDRNLAEAYQPVLDALERAGATYEGRTYQGPARQHYQNPYRLTEDPLTNGYADVPGRSRMRQMVWDEVRRQQARGLLRDLPDNPEAFERQANEAVRGRLERIRDVQSRATRMGQVGGFVGGVAGSFQDPVNIATLPIGGEARTIVGGFARSIIENMLVEGFSQPAVRQNYAALGEPMTIGDSIQSVLVAGGMGGAFHVGAAGIGAAARGIRAGVQRLLPEALWTADGRAAVNVAEREDEMYRATPYEPGQAGDTAHVDALQQSLDRMQREGRAAPPAPARAAEAPAPAPAPARAPTTSPTDDVAAIDDYMAHVGRHESGGRSNAQNDTTSAGGRFQFTDGTFRSYYRRLYGTDPGPHPPAALKYDDAVQARLMRALTADNAALLRRGRYAVDRGNLFLLHFLGPDGMRVLRASPDTPVERVVAHGSIAANPTILPGRTAGDVIAWAHRAMGGHAPEIRAAAAAPEPARPESGGEFEAAAAADGEAVALSRATIELEPTARDAVPAYADPPALRRDLFTSEAEWATAQDAIDAGARGTDPHRFDPMVHVEASRAAAGDGEIRIEQLAAALDISPAEARQVRALAMAAQTPGAVRGAEPGRGASPLAGETLPPARDRPFRDWMEEAVGTSRWAVARQLGSKLRDEFDLAVPRERFAALHNHWRAENGLAPDSPAEAARTIQNPLSGVEARRDQLGRVAARADAGGYGARSAAVGSAARAEMRGIETREARYARLRAENERSGLDQFDDPAGKGAQAQADSIAHDLAADIEANPELGAMHFTIEEGGPSRPLSEILATLDGDVAAAKALEACL